MWRDYLPGGLADKKKPQDFNSQELRRGVSVEREHTRSGHLQREIAMDHLQEDPDYYKKLKYVEEKTLPYIQKVLRDYETKKKLEKTARLSMRDVAGNPTGRAALLGALTGAGVGAIQSPKDDKLKGTLRAMIYGSAAGIGASERMSPILQARFKKMMSQRSFLRHPFSKWKKGNIHEHWARLAREDRPQLIAAGTVGGGAGLGLTELGISALNKIRAGTNPDGTTKKRKRKTVPVFIR